MSILGFAISGNTLVNSFGETCHDNYLDFLLKYCDRDDVIRVAYNLDWLVSRLCYLLNIPEWQLKKLWSTSHGYYQGWKLFYVPHRYFGYKYGQHWGEANLSDIFQFQIDLPFDIDPLDAAKKAQELGEEVYESMTMLGLHPKTLSSPVSAYLKEILSTHDLPNHEDIPTEVQQYAYDCLRGGWQECFKQGHFDNAFDYDITSAYSHYTANLIDHRYGKWVKSNKFFSKAPMGYCKGIVRVGKGFNPIIYDTGKMQTTPTGERPDTLTNKQVKNLYDRGIGQFKVESAWYWWPDGELHYPFKEDMEILFEWKQKSKGMLKEIVKRIMVGTWGLLTQTFKDKDDVKLGKLFDTVSASQIETQTKTQVSDFVIDNHAEDDLLAIAVDGSSFRRKIPLTETGEMGTWRLNTEAPAVVVSSGVGAIKGKQNKGTFSLNYDWLAGQIAANPDATEYKMSKMTPVTIGNALKNNKLDKLGELEMTERAVFVGIENKRFYKESPLCGRDLYKQYSSEPLDVSVLNKIVLDDTSEIE